MFRYKGRTYDSCITHGNNGVPWCSTSVNEQGEHIESSVKSVCPNDTCHLNNCPIGFSWLAPTETCYQESREYPILELPSKLYTAYNTMILFLKQISAPIPRDTIGTQDHGKLKCMEQGARLFTPRSTRAIDFFNKFEVKHITKDGMFQYATADSRQAIGMMYVMESENTEGKLKYR